MTLREYLPEDIEQILKLFYNTVHMVNAADYSPAQLDAWRPKIRTPRNGTTRFA